MHPEFLSTSANFGIAPNKAALEVVAIKLLGDIEVLYNRRKNDMTYDLIKMKQEIIKNLSFSENTKVFEIDATLDKFEIKKKILNIIGEFMSIK